MSPAVINFLFTIFTPYKSLFSMHAAEIKKLEEVTHQQIANAFERDDLIIYTYSQDFEDFLFAQNFENKTLLLMSSGNYGGLDFDEVKRLF